MGDIKLFKVSGSTATEIPGSSTPLERALQQLIEGNLESCLGIQFLASEYSTGPKHGGRIDSLGLDENGCPVIIEYKRTTNDNVINQGLFYLDWLMDHQGTFQLLVAQKLGDNAANEIDWSGPRLICIAGGFTKYDEHAVQQINRNIELIRYRYFNDDLLLLELVNATTASQNSSANPSSQPNQYKTISETLAEIEGPIADLYDEIRTHLFSIGDDVQEKTLKYYTAFKRIKNFACLEVRPAKGSIVAFVKINPESLSVEEGFTRDMRGKGHYGTGELEIVIKDKLDFERAKPLFQQSYDVC